jgi:hypothetical protein
MSWKKLQEKDVVILELKKNARKGCWHFGKNVNRPVRNIKDKIKQFVWNKFKQLSKKRWRVISRDFYYTKFDKMVYGCFTRTRRIVESGQIKHEYL